VCSGGNQASWHRGSVSDKGLKAEFFGWNAEFNQLGFVDANGIIVSFGGVGKGVFEIPKNTVLRFDGFFHVLADVIYSGLVKATALNELSQCQLLLFKLGHEDAQLVLELLVFIVSSALKLIDCNLELAIHFILLRFNLFEFIIENGSIGLDFLRAVLDVLQASLSVFVAHDVLIEGGDELTELVSLLF
jgi:hypothetical protein